MKLDELLVGIEAGAITGPAEVAVRSIAYDSRKVEPGAIFFAMHGEKLDGAKFVSDALAKGAIAVASESVAPADFPPNATWVQLLPGSARRGLASASANFYRHPAQGLKLVGITGTNGKTTTAFLVDSILRTAGYSSALIGTTGYRTPKSSYPAANTTPESLDLQQIFAEIRESHGTHVVLEASSHALAMERLWTCHFAAAVFTNLTRDHLDYHKTMEEYFAAKRHLFEGTGAGAPDVAVINADDPYASKLAGLAPRTLTYGLKNGPDLAAKKFSLELWRPRIHGADARRKHRRALASRRPHQYLQYSRRHRRGACARDFPRPRSKKASPHWKVYRAASSVSTKGSRSWWWLTTRIRMTRCAI